MENNIEKKELRNFYDLEEIKRIPIEEIAELYSKPILQKNSTNWVNIREENTASCKIYNTNTFCDFGNGWFGGDNIIFLAYCEGIDHKLSEEERYSYIEKLANLFGVQPQNLIQEKNVDIELTNEQWKRIGIHGDLASKNIEFDFDKYTDEQNINLAQKYRISMNELIKTNEKGYYKILSNKAVPYVFNKRNDYYYQCFLEDRMSIEIKVDIFKSKDIMNSLEKEKNELQLCEKTLKYAIKDEEQLSYKYGSYDVKSDIENIRNGKISFQVGNIDYMTLKKFENVNGHNILFETVSYSQYSFLRSYKIDELPHSAFVKGNVVNICYTQNDQKLINREINEVREIKDLDLEMKKIIVNKIETEMHLDPLKNAELNNSLIKQYEQLKLEISQKEHRTVKNIKHL